MTNFSFLFVLEMLGTAAFAISGALAAARKGMDIFGFIVLALMPAVGGGTLRDVILDRHPVFWVANTSYVAIALIAAIVVYFSFYKPGGRQRILIWMDAMGLALFATLATRICLDFETGPVVAVMLGVASAVTGGMIRDIICNEIPLILTREVYATAAFISSATYVGLYYLDVNSQLALALAVIAGITVRGLSIVFHWSLPTSEPRE